MCQGRAGIAVACMAWGGGGGITACAVCAAAVALPARCCLGQMQLTQIQPAGIMALVLRKPQNRLMRVNEKPTAALASCRLGVRCTHSMPAMQARGEGRM